MNALLVLFLVLDILISLGMLIIRVGGHDSKKGDWEEGDSTSQYSPKILVILPVKGKDFEMKINFQSLLDQSYDNYRIIAVADREDDESLEVIKELGMAHIISETECQGCSGKVKAILTALLKFSDFDYYVIADSDIRVDRNWLQVLVEPLKDKLVGVTTTFPIFVARDGFWSNFKMYWGLIGRSMMESEITRFAWGGSLAFRRDLVDESDLKYFSTFISDDIALMKICKSKGLHVSYRPGARVFIHSRESFLDFVEWSNRQTALSISSSEKIFYYGVAYYLAIIFLLVTSVVLTSLGIWYFSFFLLLFMYVAIDNLRKVPIRNLYFLPSTFLTFFFYLYNLVAARGKKKILWRGREYSLYP